ncbi:potassium voltage-gated channel protein Shaw-like [Tubulanus polymorphus]|uniref:potassium voltage-gated channel protein Shaw-like n=1 Tax=Tubulanus polymorphus TaxID=672921 RepID=UPI003DA325D9
MSMKDLVTLNVGGQIFLTKRSTLTTIPETRLGELTEDCEHYDKDTQCYYFDRNPQIFQFILDCYRTGEFHFPSYLCGRTITAEMEYWGLSSSRIAYCCLQNRDQYMADESVVGTLIRDCLVNAIQITRKRLQAAKGYKQKLYKFGMFLEYPSLSRPAKIWSLVYLTMVLLSVISFSLQSIPQSIFRVTAKHLKLNESEKPAVWNKSQLDKFTDVAPWVLGFDVTLNLIFSLEWLFRAAIAPPKLHFFRSKINIVEMICNISFWVYFCLIIVKMQGIYPQWVANIHIVVLMLQPFRVLRLLKLARTFRQFNTIVLAIQSSGMEFFILSVFLGSGVLFFAIEIYYAELSVSDTFYTIPVGMWWALVTMTTVGFGDHYPKGVFGYVVGTGCAVTGILITGMTISILTSKITTFYRYSDMQNTFEVGEISLPKQFLMDKDDEEDDEGTAIDMVCVGNPKYDNNKKDKSNGHKRFTITTTSLSDGPSCQTNYYSAVDEDSKSPAKSKRHKKGEGKKTCDKNTKVHVEHSLDNSPSKTKALLPSPHDDQFTEEAVTCSMVNDADDHPRSISCEPSSVDAVSVSISEGVCCSKER